MKQKLYIHAKQNKARRYAEPEIFVSIYHHKTDQWDIYVLLKTFEVEVPDIEIDLKAFTIAQIEQLRDQIKVEEAESYLRVVAMEETIQILMCLEQK